MGSTFFTGGMMPADRMFLGFQRDLALVDHWRILGTHYAKTLRAWLERLDSGRPRALEILGQVYGAGQAARQFQRWRLFLIGCEESFAYRGGNEWYVSHYLFESR
jgi:cyclopropane-fatty-acyl-phospholipid synthase